VANAHTGDLIVTASCNEETGQYDVLAVLNVANTSLAGDGTTWTGNSTFAGTPTEADPSGTGFVVTGSGQYTLTTFSLPGTTTGFGPWIYSFVKFSDGFKVGSDGQLTEELDGDCVIPKDPPPTNQECQVFTTQHFTSLAGIATGESSIDGSAYVRIGSDNLHVATFDNDPVLGGDQGHRKGAFYHDVANFSLANLGDFVLTQSGTGSAIGGQVRVDRTGDGVWDFTLVIEDLYGDAYIWASIPGGGTWVAQPWAPHAVGGGGYPNQGSIDQWIATLYDADQAFVVDQVGGSLGSGVTGDQRVTLLQAGCFKFTYGAPTQPPVEYRESSERQVDCEAGEATVTTTYESRSYGAWDEASASYPVGAWTVYDTDVSSDELTEEEYLECYGDQPDPEAGVDKSQECDGSILVSTETAWTQTWEATPTGYVLGEKVYADPKVSRAADPSCAPLLALSGSIMEPSAWIAGASLLGLGAALAVIAAARARRETQV
jgi:hypothetical protein